MRIILVLLLMTGSLVAGDTFKAQVTSGTDDAKTYGSNLSTSEIDAVVGYTGSYRCDYLARFGEVPIPPEATIDSAFLSLHSSASQSGTVCNSLIYAEDTGNAATFSTWNNYDSRLLSDQAVAWNNIPAHTSAVWYRTPDIKNLIQEIVDRSDWSHGNALAVFIKDNNSDGGAYRRFYQYERPGSNGASACSLLVFYTESSNGTIAPARRRRLTQAVLSGRQPLFHDAGYPFNWSTINIIVNSGSKDDKAKSCFAGGFLTRIFTGRGNRQ
ncbi:MAG: hypothetical protein PHU88_12120 [candidate division Zixibacteria bacterium]|nr:hypothetical protein [candidate division Zixibacteria bacterium]MDD5425955.1 hypothetical protein [candidate division Zixibacteria bacterium]